MAGNLIIKEGREFYEIDEECLKRKEGKKENGSQKWKNRREEKRDRKK